LTPAGLLSSYNRGVLLLFANGTGSELSMCTALFLAVSSG